MIKEEAMLPHRRGSVQLPTCYGPYPLSSGNISLYVSLCHISMITVGAIDGVKGLTPTPPPSATPA
jgi:hypothetical protein